MQRYLETALQIEISLGSTQNCWEQASAAVEEPYLELERKLRRPVSMAKTVKFLATSAQTQRLSPFSRQPVSSTFNTGSVRNFRSNSK